MTEMWGIRGETWENMVTDPLTRCNFTASSYAQTEISCIYLFIFFMCATKIN